MPVLKAKLKFKSLDDQDILLNIIRTSLSSFKPENENAAIFRAVLVQVFEKMVATVDRNWSYNRHSTTMRFTECESRGIYALLGLFLDHPKSINPYVDSLAREWYQSLQVQNYQIFPNKYNF